MPAEDSKETREREWESQLNLWVFHGMPKEGEEKHVLYPKPDSHPDANH